MTKFRTGRWARKSRKSTVEDAFAIRLRDCLSPDDATLVWRRGGVELLRCSTRFVSSADGSFVEITLLEKRLSLDVVEIVRPGGGKRRYLACPRCPRKGEGLFFDATRCDFACRCCLSLTYSSSQRAHMLERLIAKALPDVIVDGMMRRRFFRPEGGQRCQFHALGRHKYRISNVFRPSVDVVGDNA